jgi:hypothetical protein
VKPRRLVRRHFFAFYEGHVSVRNAIGAIVGATVVTVFTGAVLMRIVDHEEYPTLGKALWWALQTVTTVGYGDVTPQRTEGRIIGALVLIYSIAFLTILTAVITTTFIERARAERARAERRAAQTRAEWQLDPERGPDVDGAAVLERLDEIASRLGELERRLAAQDAGPPPPG